MDHTTWSPYFELSNIGTTVRYNMPEGWKTIYSETSFKHGNHFKEVSEATHFISYYIGEWTVHM